MGWISDLLQGVSAPPEELTFLDKLTIPGTKCEVIKDGECYIEIWIESLRLEKARKFTTFFDGAVYVYETLAREGGASSTLAAVSKPAMLAKLDPSSLGRVITVSRQLLGAVPWCGGSLHLELGLFSVKSGNLLSPILDFVTQVSSTAGISFVGQVTPFVPLLVRGMDMLAGQTSDVALEVGLDTDIDLKTSGIYAIVAMSKKELAGRQVAIDSTDRKLLLDGVPVDSGYCVFSIRQTTKKADFGEVPELREKYAALREAIKTNNWQTVEDALTAFRLAVVASPDLIPSDAARLIEKAKARVELAKGGIAGALHGTLSSTDVTMPATLGEIGLYQ
jgi:hypothetical protein